MNQNSINELTQRISELLPDRLHSMPADIENSLHALLQDYLTKLNLVTREEFEIQSAVLQRSREKLDKLEKQLQQLEKSASK